MLVFVATDGSEWIPTKVLGGVLTTIDVAAFVREAFPRQFIMMYDASTCTRLSEALPTKLSKSGETRIITPLVESTDYAATEWFTCRPVEDIRWRLETLSCVFKCLRDNLTKQTTRINAEVSQTKATIDAHKEETSRLLKEMPSFLETLEQTICPTSAGRTALAVLGVNPNLAQRMEERIVAKEQEFQQLEGDIQLDIQKQQDFMEDQANRIEETVGKVGASGLMSGSGGGASGLSTSATSSQTTHMAKVVRIVQGFRKQTHVVIGQWRTFIRHLGLLRTAAEPLELRRLQRCATQLPIALDELRPLLAARCAFAHAASSLVAPLEPRYLALCERSRTWRSRYGDILEELAHVAPHSTEPLPTALLPRDKVVPFSLANAMEPETTEVQRDQIFERAVSDLLLIKDGSGSPSSSLGAPSRQCTATPPQQQPSASEASRIEEVEAQLREMEALLAKSKEESSVARDAMESGRRAVEALEATLTSRETELVHAREHATRLATELANSRNKHAAAEAIDYMQRQLQLGASNPHAFFSFPSRGSDQGEWCIGNDAPPAISGKTFTVRVDALQRDVTMDVLVSVQLRAGKEEHGGDAGPSVQSNVYDGDTRQCVNRCLIGRQLDFERNGKGCKAVFVLPHDHIRPDLRGAKVAVDLHPDSTVFHASSTAGGGAAVRPDRVSLSVVEVTSEVELTAIALCAK